MLYGRAQASWGFWRLCKLDQSNVQRSWLMAWDKARTGQPSAIEKIQVLCFGEEGRD